MTTMPRRPGLVLAGLVLAAGIATATHAGDTASGSLTYKGRFAAFKYAWLVT